MKVSPFRPARAFRDYLTAAEFAAEAGITIAAVRARGRRQQIFRRWYEKHCAPNRIAQWLYFVGDLPDGCGSQYLADFLTKNLTVARVKAAGYEERLERVLLARRAGRAA